MFRRPKDPMVLAPACAPRVLTIRATPAQMEQVRLLLDQYESTGSTACARPPAHRHSARTAT